MAENVPNTRECQTCNAAENLPTLQLKSCAKCLNALYCSRDCQRADWKTHKRVCGGGGPTKASTSGASAANTSTGSAAPGSAPPSAGGGTRSDRHNPGFHAVNHLMGMSDDKHLHSLPEPEAFAQLIDSFRMRVEDEYVFGARNIGIYGGGDPRPPFKAFLDLAEGKRGILPPWWSVEKRAECERMATGGEAWNDINCAVEKADIQKHYGDPSMPMKLRILAEKIYGKGLM